MNKKTIIAIVIIILLVALLGGLIYFATKDSSSTSNTNNNETSQTGMKSPGNFGGHGGTGGNSGTSSSSISSNATSGKNGYPALSDILSEVESKYTQATFEDTKTGLSIEYNIFVPDNYDSSKSYPMVVFIADSSLVGRGANASLEQGFGGVIWATSSEQAKHESIILVPTYSEVIIDDNNGYTTSEYIEATKNLIDEISSKYSIDTNRIYATGQSMGGMTMLYLSSKYPDLFAAELFVSCQWKIDELQNINTQKFFYIVAGGDQKALAGQKDVLSYLQSKNVNVSTISDVDATLSSTEMNSKIETMLKENNKVNMVTFTTGTVLSGSSSSGMGSSEHMSSFNYAYRIEAVRDWLFEQSK